MCLQTPDTVACVEWTKAEARTEDLGSAAWRALSQPAPRGRDLKSESAVTGSSVRRSLPWGACPARVGRDRRQGRCRSRCPTICARSCGAPYIWSRYASWLQTAPSRTLPHGSVRARMMFEQE